MSPNALELKHVHTIDEAKPGSTTFLAPLKEKENRLDPSVTTS